jgi:NAD(P)H-dependent FMN reductase
MDPARLLVVCGSWQPTSANAAIVRRAAARAHAVGAVTDQFLRLREVPPFDPLLVDDAPPSVVELRNAVVTADAVLIAAPEYAGALAGVVKNALDWLVGAGSMWDRTVGVACAGTTGGFFARRDLAQTLAWQGALVVTHLGIAAPRTKSDVAGEFTDLATREQIDGFVDHLLRLAERPRAERIAAARAVAVELSVDPARVAADQDD